MARVYQVRLSQLIGIVDLDQDQVINYHDLVLQVGGDHKVLPVAWTGAAQLITKFTLPRSSWTTTSHLQSWYCSTDIIISLISTSIAIVNGFLDSLQGIENMTVY